MQNVQEDSPGRAFVLVVFGYYEFGAGVQMAEAWDGRSDVELICGSHAANAAENAVRTIDVLRGLD